MSFCLCLTTLIKAQLNTNQMKYQSLTPNMGVESVNETVKSYTEVLGFTKIVSVPESGELIFAILNAEDVNIMFQQKENLQEEYSDLKSLNQNPCFTFYIKVENMNALYEYCRDTDLLVKEIHTTPYGAEEVAIRDNNGFILTITEASE